MATKVRVGRGARRELSELGRRLKLARLRRRLPASLIAERAAISARTLQKIEAGDPAVKIGSYAAVLQALGLIRGWGSINDPEGERISIDDTPQRARLSDGG